MHRKKKDLHKSSEIFIIVTGTWCFLFFIFRPLFPINLFIKKSIYRIRLFNISRSSSSLKMCPGYHPFILTIRLDRLCLEVHDQLRGGRGQFNVTSNHSVQWGRFSYDIPPRSYLCNANACYASKCYRK